MFFEKNVHLVGCASVHSLSEVMVMGSNVKPQILKSKQCNGLCPWDHLHCTDDKHVPLFTPQLRWDRQGEDCRVTINTSHTHCIIKKVWFPHKEMSQTHYIEQRAPGFGINFLPNIWPFLFLTKLTLEYIILQIKKQKLYIFIPKKTQRLQRPNI